MTGPALRRGNPVPNSEFGQAGASDSDCAGKFMSHGRPKDAIDLAASSHDVLAANAARFYFHEDLAPSWDRNISRTRVENFTATEC
jgi:hypothetical protein